MPNEQPDDRNPELGAKQLESLLQLPLQQLIKSDDDYIKICQRRAQRLEALASKSARPEGFLRCSELTTLTHQLADELKAAIAKVRTMYSLSHEEKLRHIFAWSNRLAKPVSTDPMLQNLPPEVTDRVRASTLKAREFLLELARNPSQAKARTYGDALEARFRNESSTTRFGINMEVQTTLRALDSFELHSGILKSYAALAIIYRGLVYSGIMEREGGSLKRRALREQGMETGEEVLSTVLGSIPGVDKAISLIKLVRIWAKDGEAELVETRDFIEDFLQGYSELLTLWHAAASALASAMNEAIGASGFCSEGTE